MNLYREAQDGEASRILKVVPVEPDLSYVAELVSELYKHVRSQPAAFNSYQWAQRFVWRVQVGEDSTP